mmetsp:Transcript_2362/g.7043  ORF Transcript_2362/g.7043 Transcript_2362/m.7043 type:complete len:388 (+) Transcript_2362:32-1195(+)
MVLHAHCLAALFSLIMGGMNVLIELAYANDGSQAVSTNATSAVETAARTTVFALYRDLGGATILGITAVKLGKIKWDELREHARNIALAGMCGIGGQLFFVSGLALTDADVAGLFSTLNPVATMALAVATGLERCSSYNAVGLALATLGLGFGVDFASLNVSSLLGVVLLAVNICTNAVYGVASRFFTSSCQIHYLAYAAVAYVGGATFVVLAAIAGAIAYPDQVSAKTLSLSGPQAAALTYTILLSSALAYPMGAYIASKIEPSVLMIWVSTQVIFTAIFSYMFLGHAPTARQCGAAAALCLAVAIVCYPAVIAERRAKKRAGMAQPLVDGQVAVDSQRDSAGTDDEMPRGPLAARVHHGAPRPLDEVQPLPEPSAENTQEHIHGL